MVAVWILVTIAHAIENGMLRGRKHEAKTGMNLHETIPLSCKRPPQQWVIFQRCKSEQSPNRDRLLRRRSCSEIAVIGEWRETEVRTLAAAFLTTS